MSALRGSSRALAAVLVAAAAACYVGPNINEFPGLRSAAGAWCKLNVPRLPGGELQGELLAVDSSSAVLLTSPPQVWVVPYTAIGASNCERAGPIPFYRDALVQDQAREIRLMSRYPQGISRDVMARLLAAYRQTEPRTPPSR
jgi:hypothetical protein